ncbi:MAG TPA: hypothetical protein VF403_18740 [Kofleriaceae bacterium]
MHLSARLAILLVLSGTAGSSRADDLPPELVARPPTLPDGMIATTLDGGYDSVQVLGVSVLSATSLGLEIQRGMTPRLELALATGFALHPDPRWSRDGSVALAYRAWTGGAIEVAPSLTIPLTARDGVDNHLDDRPRHRSHRRRGSRQFARRHRSHVGQALARRRRHQLGRRRRDDRQHAGRLLVDDDRFGPITR